MLAAPAYEWQPAPATSEPTVLFRPFNKAESFRLNTFFAEVVIGIVVWSWRMASTREVRG